MARTMLKGTSKDVKIDLKNASTKLQQRVTDKLGNIIEKNNEVIENDVTEKSDKNSLYVPFQSIIADFSTNYREEEFYGDIKQLSLSILENGQKEAVTVVRNQVDRSKFNLLHGFRRYKAFQLLEKDGLTPKMIKVNVIKSSEVNEEFIIFDHLIRNDSKAFETFEEANIYNRLVNNLKWTPKNLAKKLGKSEQHISNMLKLHKTPQELKQMVKDGLITANTVLDIVKEVEPKEQVAQAKIGIENAKKEAIKKNKPVKPATSKNVPKLVDKKEKLIDKKVEQKIDEIINITPPEPKVVQNPPIVQNVSSLPKADQVKPIGDNDTLYGKSDSSTTFIDDNYKDDKTSLMEDYKKALDKILSLPAIKAYKTVLENQFKTNLTPIVEKMLDL